jgi:glycine betaine/proline transport system permease protein
MDYLTKHPKILQFGIVLIVFFALCILVAPSETNFLWRLPAYLAGVPKILNNSVEFVMFEWLPISTYNAEIEDYETSALMIEITRSISRGVLFGIELIREILVGGQKTIVAFTRWDWIGENKWAVWPALPWTVVAGCGIALGYALKGRGLAILVACATGYLSFFGQWEPAMETLSFVLIAAPLSVVLGIFWAVLAFKSRAVENAMMPLLNVAQTMPHFSYLVPVTVFLGWVIMLVR